MLINKNIYKVEEKFDLLFNYINEKNLWEAIYLNKEKNGNIFIKNVFIPEKKACRILSISLRTLRNWYKRHLYSPYRSIGYIIRHGAEHSSIKLESTIIHSNPFINERLPKHYRKQIKSPYFETSPYNEKHINIRELFSFLSHELSNLNY